MKIGPLISKYIEESLREKDSSKQDALLKLITTLSAYYLATTDNKDSKKQKFSFILHQYFRTARELTEEKIPPNVNSSIVHFLIYLEANPDYKVAEKSSKEIALTLFDKKSVTALFDKNRAIETIKENNLALFNRVEDIFKNIFVFKLWDNLKEFYDFLDFNDWKKSLINLFEAAKKTKTPHSSLKPFIQATLDAFILKLNSTVTTFKKAKAELMWITELIWFGELLFTHKYFAAFLSHFNNQESIGFAVNITITQNSSPYEISLDIISFFLYRGFQNPELFRRLLNAGFSTTYGIYFAIESYKQNPTKELLQIIRLFIERGANLKLMLPFLNVNIVTYALALHNKDLTEEILASFSSDKATPIKLLELASAAIRTENLMTATLLVEKFFENITSLSPEKKIATTTAVAEENNYLSSLVNFILANKLNQYLETLLDFATTNLKKSTFSYQSAIPITCRFSYPNSKNDIIFNYGREIKFSLVSLAIFYENLAATKILIARGFSIDGILGEKLPPLITAFLFTKETKNSFVALLLKDADVNITDIYGNHPLFLASRQNSEKELFYEILRKSNPEEINIIKNMDELEIVLYNIINYYRDIELLKLFLEKFPIQSYPILYRALYEAVCSGNHTCYAMVSYLLHDTTTYLSSQSAVFLFNIILYIEHGTKLLNQKQIKFTANHIPRILDEIMPLMGASQSFNLTLTHTKHDVKNVICSQELYTEHPALVRGICEQLLRFINNPYQQEKQIASYSADHTFRVDFCPITMACLVGKDALLKIALSKRENRINAKIDKQALELATNQGHIQCVKLLLEAGMAQHYDLNEKFFPLTLAVDKQFLKIVELFVYYAKEKGALYLLRQIYDENDSLLALAITRGNLEILRVLLNAFSGLNSSEFQHYLYKKLADRSMAPHFHSLIEDYIKPRKTHQTLRTSFFAHEEKNKATDSSKTDTTAVKEKTVSLPLSGGDLYQKEKTSPSQDSKKLIPSPFWQDPMSSKEQEIQIMENPTKHYLPSKVAKEALELHLTALHNFAVYLHNINQTVIIEGCLATLLQFTEAANHYLGNFRETNESINNLRKDIAHHLSLSQNQNTTIKLDLINNAISILEPLKENTADKIDLLKNIHFPAAKIVRKTKALDFEYFSIIKQEMKELNEFLALPLNNDTKDVITAAITMKIIALGGAWTKIIKNHLTPEQAKSKLAHHQMILLAADVQKRYNLSDGFFCFLNVVEKTRNLLAHLPNKKLISQHRQNIIDLFKTEAFLEEIANISNTSSEKDDSKAQQSFS